MVVIIKVGGRKQIYVNVEIIYIRMFQIKPCIYVAQKTKTTYDNINTIKINFSDYIINKNQYIRLKFTAHWAA